MSASLMPNLMTVYDQLDDLKDHLRALEGLRDLYIETTQAGPSAQSTGTLLQVLHDDYHTRVTTLLNTVDTLLNP